ncbi:21064_t:CDS:1, partial [Racocetra persica]
MKFNLFLLFLTIFAIVAFSYPSNNGPNHNMMKRQNSTNPNCDPNACCNPGDAQCFAECNLPSCACDPTSCCQPNDNECAKL